MAAFKRLFVLDPCFALPYPARKNRRDGVGRARNLETGLVQEIGLRKGCALALHGRCNRAEIGLQRLFMASGTASDQALAAVCVGSS
jgi:hypothetical protein